ncbi:hypothetical protein PENSPDRAFT_749698 [Peniophora sp. CONT]|nr:hypothetical protein PENSPDRAFT_749698 [Peniophora sp. CONT]
MSAYGPQPPRPDRPLLPSTAWHLAPAKPGKPASPFSHLTLHHLTGSAARSFDGLIDYTYSTFAAEIESGLTYPQEVAYGEKYSREAFEGYFWGADVLLAIGATEDEANAANGATIEGGIEEARQGRSWEDCLVGFYYVKPNYPGRSSHICNAGFMITPAHRQFGYGKVLGGSYLHYGPALGFKASVFNLVYTSNVGSLRIWDSLGFQRAGLIPRAGRLRKPDGSGEEWTDAVVFYRSFLAEDEWTQVP